MFIKSVNESACFFSSVVHPDIVPFGHFMNGKLKSRMINISGVGEASRLKKEYYRVGILFVVLRSSTMFDAYNLCTRRPRQGVELVLTINVSQN